jgi:chitodextrinase
MKKNYAKSTLVSSLVLSIALLSSSQADASIFSKLKNIAKGAVHVAGKVVTDKGVQQAVLGAGKAAAGIIMKK